MVRESVVLCARLGLAALLGAVGFPGCGGSRSQFEVKGEERQLVELAGDWEGSFVGVDTGRKGEISFSITVGRHTADGEVLMYPNGASAEPEPLDVRFAEIAEDGSIHGKIAPYIEPQCKCQVVTEFDGIVVGDRIEGTFVTRAVDSDLSQSGRWWVEKQP